MFRARPSLLVGPALFAMAASACAVAPFGFGSQARVLSHWVSAPGDEAAREGGPRVAIWARYQTFGGTRRVTTSFRMVEDGYALVGHVDANGTLRVLFPQHPADSGFVRAGESRVLPEFDAGLVSMYSNRQALIRTNPQTVGSRRDSYDGGSAYLFVIASRSPLNVDSLAAGNAWRRFEVDVDQFAGPRAELERLAFFISGSDGYTLEFVRSETARANIGYARNMSYDAGCADDLLYGSWYGYAFSSYLYSPYRSSYYGSSYGCGYGYSDGYADGYYDGSLTRRSWRRYGTGGRRAYPPDSTAGTPAQPRKGLGYRRRSAADTGTAGAMDMGYRSRPAGQQSGGNLDWGSRRPSRPASARPSPSSRPSSDTPRERPEPPASRPREYNEPRPRERERTSPRSEPAERHDAPAERSTPAPRDRHGEP